MEGNAKHYDLLVVGSGPGGQHAAVAAAQMGKRVALIERKPYLGGVSLQTGTIPSKALREFAFLASRFAAKGMRASLARPQLARGEILQEAMQQKARVVESKEAQVLNQLLKAGVAIVPGTASFLDPHTLQVTKPQGDSERFSGDVIVLATGSRPRRPPEIPFDRERIFDSTGLLKIRRLPSSIIVVGGGVIACEFATLFAPLGVAVTIVDSHAQILGYLDKDIADILMDDMLDMGISLHMNTQLARVVRVGEQVELHTQEQQIHQADCLLYAMGRQPNYEALHIEAASLAADDHGWISVNQYYQTQCSHIYVVGDLAGAPALAATAMEQGRIAVNHAFLKRLPPKSGPLPMAVYTIPELAYVGESERQLSQRGQHYVVGVAVFAETARGQIIGDQRGRLKLLADRADGKILGVHIIGEAASELLHIGQMALGCEQTVHVLARNVFNYPTLAECYKLAALRCAKQLDR